MTVFGVAAALRVPPSDALAVSTIRRLLASAADYVVGLAAHAPDSVHDAAALAMIEVGYADTRLAPNQRFRPGLATRRAREALGIWVQPQRAPRATWIPRC